MLCYHRGRNDEVLQWAGLTSLSHLLTRRRISVFGHVTRLDDDTPANVAFQLHVVVSDLLTARGVAHLVFHGTSGLTSYETIPRPIGELWRCAVDRRHGGATTRRPSPAMRQ